jgi:hypothetical protein
MEAGEKESGHEEKKKWRRLRRRAMMRRLGRREWRGRDHSGKMVVGRGTGRRGVEPNEEK